MIRVSRLNNQDFYINPDRIEFIEETPDTVISMDSGRKLVVVEPAQVIIERMIAYKQRILQEIPVRTTGQRT